MKQEQSTIIIMNLYRWPISPLPSNWSPTLHVFHSQIPVLSPLVQVILGRLAFEELVGGWATIGTAAPVVVRHPT